MHISDTTLLNVDTGAAIALHKNRFAVNRTAGSIPVWKPVAEPVYFAPSQIVSSNVEVGQKPGFKDLLDVINPLQHIPVIGHFYRKMTGDEISPTAQFVGGAIFGGPIGAAVAITDIAVREQTGKGGIDTMMGILSKGEDGEEKPFPIHLARRKAQTPRMAGTIPVWGQDNNQTMLASQTNPVPGGNLSADTKFALLLNSLGDGPHKSSNPNIS